MIALLAPVTGGAGFIGPYIVEELLAKSGSSPGISFKEGVARFEKPTLMTAGGFHLDF